MYRQFNIQQFYVLPTQCIYVICVDLRTNSDYFPAQHYLPGVVSVFKCCTVYHRVGSCQSLTNGHFA